MTKAVDTLRSLVQTTIDSAEGFERASENARTPHLKQVLRDWSGRRRQLVTELNAELVRLGGETQESGSTAGSLHHAWTRISDAFKNGDEAAAERVEEGEDYIEKKFRKALDDIEWEPRTREVLQRAHAQTVEGERMSDQLEEQFD